MDTNRTPIEAVVRAILHRNRVLDLTISDPPMEEVITALYESAGYRRLVQHGQDGRDATP